MRLNVAPVRGPLQGTLRVPGDKSISHRVVLFAALAAGTSELAGVLDSADVRSTMAAVTALGALVDLAPCSDGSLAGTVGGWGAAGPRSPLEAIDCGNSGTTTRLLLGVLAGWPVVATLEGDASLSARPMTRVTAPLSEMGARFTTREGMLPVTVEGSADLAPLDYRSPVASAQVKSAVLLAGMRAHGRTRVSEPAPSRDHTERLLPDFGVAIGVDAETHAAWVDGPLVPHSARVTVPADPSSAAFPVVAALIVPGSEVLLTEVGLNPTRTGFLKVLARMGADIEITIAEDSGSELFGDVRARYTGALGATTVTADEVPSLIDEVPVLAVAAAFASGTTRFEGVGELRVKESDRLRAIYDALSSLNVPVSVENDALEITGTGGHPLMGGVTADAHDIVLDSLGDHRLAMAWAVLGLATTNGLAIEGFEAVDVSYPRFREDLAALGAW